MARHLQRKANISQTALENSQHWAMLYGYYQRLNDAYNELRFFTGCFYVNFINIKDKSLINSS